MNFYSKFSTVRYIFLLFIFFASLDCYASDINWEAHEKENAQTTQRLKSTVQNYSKQFEDIREIEANWLSRLKELQSETKVETRQDQDRVFKRLLKEGVITEHYFNLVIEGHRFWVPHAFLKFTEDAKKYKSALSSICYGKAPGSPLSGKTMHGHHTAQMRYTPSKGFYADSGYIPDIIIVTRSTHHDESLHLQESGQSLIRRGEFSHAQKSLYKYIAKIVLNLKADTLSPPEKAERSKPLRPIKNIDHPYGTRSKYKKTISPYKGTSRKENKENISSHLPFESNPLSPPKKTGRPKRLRPDEGTENFDEIQPKRIKLMSPYREIDNKGSEEDVSSRILPEETNKDGLNSVAIKLSF